MMDHTDTITRELSREHLAAVEVMRHAKNAVFWLALVAVVLHIVSWIIVRHTDTLDPRGPVTLHEDAGSGPQSMPTEAQLRTAERWYAALGSALALGGFLGRAASLVLAGICLISLLACLTARLGGAANLAKACVWSLGAVALAMPWLRAPEEAAAVASAFYGLDELSGAASQRLAGGLLSVIRFLICPVLLAGCLCIAQIRFRGAVAQMTASPSAKLPIHEV